ncbi:MAG: hypothetical protein HKM95_02480 [Inquilinus sp.]|nr:hypothetical protein [Inquilinus sp.]
MRYVVLAIALLFAAGAANADTTKQSWNKVISAENPGEVKVADPCLKDDRSAFGCWNDKDEPEAEEEDEDQLE